MNERILGNKMPLVEGFHACKVIEESSFLSRSPPHLQVGGPPVNGEYQHWLQPVALNG